MRSVYVQLCRVCHILYMQFLRLHYITSVTFSPLKNQNKLQNTLKKARCKLKVNMEVKFIYFLTNLSDGLINSPFKIIIIIKNFQALMG